MNLEGKYDLLIIRNRYLKTTLDLTQKIINKAEPLFTKALTDELGLQQQDQQSQKEKQATTTEANPPPEQNFTEQTDEIIEYENKKKDSNLKQVFKKIASKIHPDKLLGLSDFEKDYKTSLFEKARISLEEDDYFGIVEVAEELDIEPPPPSRKQIELMKNKNKELEGKLKELENSVLWSWYHAEEDVRKLLMSKYIEKLQQMHAGT